MSGCLNFLHIKSHLKGKSIKDKKIKNEETIITNQDNEEIKVQSNIANEYIKNSKIENSIINIFASLENGNRDTVFFLDFAYIIWFCFLKNETI